MIDKTQYNKILEQGLLLDHYVILCKIKNAEELPTNKRVSGFINLLSKKGYIQEGVITDKGIEFLGNNSKLEILPTKQLVGSEPIKGNSDYAKWVVSLHKKCEEKILESTGKRQVRDTINGKAYSFLPNMTDLGRAISRVVNAYKLKDFDKIERTILAYIDRCIKSKQWFPILVYYIMKNNMSTLVTDMETIDENESKSDDTIVNI